MNVNHKMIGILGGAFDPVHNGHIVLAKTALAALSITKLHLIPCKMPVHKKDCLANPQQRVEMLELAVESCENMIVDPREINRLTPSYMLETLQSLRQDYPDQTLVLILGMDIFKTFHLWYKWSDIINYAHLAIMTRAGIEKSFSSPLQTFIDEHLSQTPQQLAFKKSGYCYFINMPPCDISSTQIRENLINHYDMSSSLDSKVLAYIEENHLYSNDL